MVAGRLKESAPSSSGFTLIEALIAMTLFAIGALMLVPTMFAWVEANNLSMQKDEMSRILDSHRGTIRYMDWDHAVWDTTVSPSTAEGFSSARNILDSASLNDLGSISGFQTSVELGDMGVTASVRYGVVAITDSDGNVFSKLMRLQGSWQGQGRAGNQRTEERLVQKVQ